MAESETVNNTIKIDISIYYHSSLEYQRGVSGGILRAQSCNGLHLAGIGNNGGEGLQLLKLAAGVGSLLFRRLIGHYGE